MTASAQLHCFVCENCENLPENLVAQQCNAIVLPTTTIPAVTSTTLDPNEPELTPIPTNPPVNNNPTKPSPPILTTPTPVPITTQSTAPATPPTNPPALVPTFGPLIVVPELTLPSYPTPIKIPNLSSNSVPEDSMNDDQVPSNLETRKRRNVEVVPAASQFSCFTLRTQCENLNRTFFLN